MQVVNNVLQVDQDSFADLDDDNSASAIILALETYVTALQLAGSGNISAVQSNVAVVAVTVPQESLKSGIGFANIPRGSVIDSLTEDDVSVFYEPNSIPVAEVKSSIQLPAAVLDYVTPGMNCIILNCFIIN